ncbi:hypothetical protein FOCC_FOCC012360, partial [Frankliniella occidentalis]
MLHSGGRPAVGPPGGRRPFNPVAELELRGHKTPRHQEDSDDPPFNFQAMLRKTNHGRASLKRRGSGEDYVYNSSSSGGGGLSAGYGSGYSNGSGRGGGGSGGHGGQFSTSPTSPSPSGRRSRSPRPDSPTRRPRDIPSSVRDTQTCGMAVEGKYQWQQQQQQQPPPLGRRNVEAAS